MGAGGCSSLPASQERERVPLERIKNDNLAFRADPDFASRYMPFGPLLFFADAGNGDQFAFVLRDRPTDVFVWAHETDSRTWIAPSLDLDHPKPGPRGRSGTRRRRHLVYTRTL